MNKGKIKVVAFLLLVLLMAGCNRAAGPGQSASSGGTLKDPNVNAAGVFPVVKEQITLSVGLPVEVRVADYNTNDMTVWLEKLTNIKLDFILYDPGNDGSTKLGLQIAANDKLPDLIFRLGIESTARRESYAEAGMLVRLNDYIDNLGVFTKEAVAQMQMTKNGFDPWFYGKDSDGNIWSYMLYEAVFANANSARAWYNEDFAKALGMSEDEWKNVPGKGKVPTQEWFLRYLRGVRDNDVNGNGDRNDEVPLSGHSGWRGNLLPWLTKMYIFNDYSSTDNFWTVNGGKLDVHYDKPEYREALRFINMLYKERLWDESALTQPNLTAITNMEYPIVGVAIGAGSGANDPRRQTYKPISVVEGPTGYAVNTYWMHTPNFPWAISKDCKYPEAAFRWLDAQASDKDFAVFCRYGVKGRDWRPVQPGEAGLYGAVSPAEPYVVELIPTWGETQNSHWRVEFGIDFLNLKSSLAWNGDVGNSEYLYGLAIQQFFGFNPTEYPVALVYTTAENERWAETRTNVRNYVLQALAQFGTGQLDPERDWETYLGNLRRLGYEQILELDRTAYARLLSSRR